MTMTAPARSAPKPALRIAMAATMAATVVLQPAAAAAQSGGGESLIRDTEIEAVIHKDVDPILRAAGIDPKGVQVVIVGTKEPNAFTTEPPPPQQPPQKPESSSTLSSMFGGSKH